MTLPPSIGRYRVDRSLGTGAFASVWLGFDDALDAPVAIKVLSTAMIDDLDVRSRFLEEARILRRADSERLISVHDMGELPDHRPYFVMSYADRGTLADRLRDDRLSVEEALRLSEETALGVAVVNSLGIIHRDLKPSNVLFQSRPGGSERVVIADLGLAKALAHASGVFTLPVGTPGYMSPEQAGSGGGLDVRADVYGLGALTYHLVTGQPPGPPPVRVAPSELRLEVPAAADHAIMRALEMERDRRWPDADSLALALAEVRAELSRPPVVPAMSAAASSGPADLPVDSVDHSAAEPEPPERPTAEPTDDPGDESAGSGDEYAGSGDGSAEIAAGDSGHDPIGVTVSDLEDAGAAMPESEPEPEPEPGTRTDITLADTSGTAVHDLPPDEPTIATPPAEEQGTVRLPTPPEPDDDGTFGFPPPPEPDDDGTFGFPTSPEPDDDATVGLPPPVTADDHDATVDISSQDVNAELDRPAAPAPTSDPRQGASTERGAYPHGPPAHGAFPSLSAPTPSETPVTRGTPPLPGIPVAGGRDGATPPSTTDQPAASYTGGPTSPGYPPGPPVPPPPSPISGTTGGTADGEPRPTSGAGLSRRTLLLIAGAATVAVVVAAAVLLMLLTGEDKPKQPVDNWRTVRDSSGRITVRVPPEWTRQPAEGWRPAEVRLSDQGQAPALRATPDLAKFRKVQQPTPGVFVGLSADVTPDRLPPPGLLRRGCTTQPGKPYKAAGLTGTIVTLTCPGGISYQEIGLYDPGKRFAVWVEVKQVGGKDLTHKILSGLRVRP